MARNADAYHRAEYKEAEVRHEFIEPFFAALGWDVHNRAGYAEQYKDVVHEESMRVAAGIEAPDYTFRIGGTRKFFVEAKKPGLVSNVVDDILGSTGKAAVIDTAWGLYRGRVGRRGPRMDAALWMVNGWGEVYQVYQHYQVCGIFVQGPARTDVLGGLD